MGYFYHLLNGDANFSIPPTNYAKDLAEIWMMNLFPGVSQLFLQCDLEDVAFDFYILNQTPYVEVFCYFFNSLENSVDDILSTYISDSCQR